MLRVISTTMSASSLVTNPKRNTSAFSVTTLTSLAFTSLLVSRADLTLEVSQISLLFVVTDIVEPMRI